MSVTRGRGEAHGTPSFGRARLSRGTVLLLVGLRWYALVSVGIAVYAFFHAVH